MMLRHFQRFFASVAAFLICINSLSFSAFASERGSHSQVLDDYGALGWFASWIVGTKTFGISSASDNNYAVNKSQNYYTTPTSSVQDKYGNVTNYYRDGDTTNTQIIDSYNKTCSRCKDTKTITLPALDHVWVETDRTPAACLTPGSIDYSCSRCSETKTEIIPQLGASHIWTVSGHTDATCTVSGVTGYTCSRCGEVKQEDSPALGHNWVESGRKDPDCVTSGFVRYSCSRCDEVKTETISQLAEDHTWVETDRTDATCTTDGFVDYDCSVCHATKTNVLPSLDHAWEEKGYMPPTCTDPGSISRTCSRCGFSAVEELPALGSDHVWEESGRTDATQTAAGSVTYTCSTCGASKSERIPPLGLDLTMSNFLEKMTEVLNVCLSWVGVLADGVTRNPILFLAVVIGFIGTGVILFRRMLKL